MRDREGASLVIFALTLPVAIGMAAFAVTYEKRNEEAAEVQNIIDGAALAAVSAYKGASSNDTGAKALALQYLSQGKDKFPDLANQNCQAPHSVCVTASNQTVSITYTSSTPLQIGSLLLGPDLPIHATSKAQMGAGLQNTPVCILITDYEAGHTLKTATAAQLHINNCMVQVNTTDWDAVQADDNSFIHIDTPDKAGNWNCYVGKIHFGDVLPDKQESCVMMPDSYADSTLPQEAYTCTDPANYVISYDYTFNPGNYCGMIKISSNANYVANIKFNPGIYYINGRSAGISIDGNVNVTSNGAVFVLTNAITGSPLASTPSPGDNLAAPPSKPGASPRPSGPGPKAAPAKAAAAAANHSPFAQFAITTTGTVTMTPYRGTDVPLLNGFILFQDPSLFEDTACSCGQFIEFANAKMSTSGAIYLVDDVLHTTKLTWTHNGALVADMFLPEYASKVTINGDPTSPFQKPTTPYPGLLPDNAVAQSSSSTTSTTTTTTSGGATTTSGGATTTSGTTTAGGGPAPRRKHGPK